VCYTAFFARYIDVLGCVGAAGARWWTWPKARAGFGLAASCPVTAAVAYAVGIDPAAYVRRPSVQTLVKRRVMAPHWGS